MLVGGEVFLVGGYSYTSGTPVSPVTLKLRSHFSPYHMKVEHECCSEGEWVEVSPLTKARQQAACAEHNGKLYVMGGYGGGGGYLTSTGSNPHRSGGSHLYLAIKIVSGGPSRSVLLQRFTTRRRTGGSRGRSCSPPSPRPRRSAWRGSSGCCGGTAATATMTRSTRLLSPTIYCVTV